MMGLVDGTCACKVVLSSMRTIFYCDTMKKGFYVMIFLAVCMIVPAVNALTIEFVPGGTAYANNEEYIDVHVSFENAEIIWLSQINPTHHYGLIYGDDVTFHDVQVKGRKITLKAVYEYYICEDPDECQIRNEYQMTVYPGEDPNAPPTPENPYLNANLMAYDVTFITYQITTEPNNQGYEFSRITTTPQDSQFSNPQWAESQSLIYSIPRGETVTFYSKAKSLLNTELISISITAPTGQEEIINQTSPEIQPNNTAYNPPPIPQVTPGSHDNPINSGKFKPSNNNFVTPFTEFVNNAKTITRLPTMTDPQVLKTEVLNGTGNITAPLYNTIDGFSTLLIFPAVTASENIQLLLQPLEEMLQYCDAVMIEIFKTVNNFFETIYPLRDFFYMLIPDFVWWIMAALLVFEIVVTIMTFVYGRGVTWYYLFGFGEHDKK